MKKILTAITLIAGVSLANADSFPYGEFAYLPFTYYETVNGTTYSATGGTAARGIIGVDLVESLALEAMFAPMAKTSGNNTKLESIYGLHVKPKIRISERATLFARMGLTFVTGYSTIYNSSFKESSTNNSISYGIGMSYKVSEILSFNADYMNYYNTNSFTVTGLGLGFGFRF